MKLTLFGKLTDFDLQILIYLSHVIVRDLVQAKINNRSYEGYMNPEELLDFLKRFKIEIQNNGGLSIDGKLVTLNENLNSNSIIKNNPGNNSSYSYLFSEHRKEEF